MSKLLGCDINAISVFRSGPIGLSDIRIIRAIMESKFGMALHSLCASFKAELLSPEYQCAGRSLWLPSLPCSY